MEKLEGRIEEIQKRLRAIDEELIKPDVYTNGRKSKKLQTERTTIAENLEPLEFEWARRAETDT